MTVAGFFLRKGADMHIKNKSGCSSLQILPFIATLMTLLAESEHLLWVLLDSYVYILLIL